MKEFFIKLQEQILLYLTDVTYVRMWNNQHELVIGGHMEMFPNPSVFIEFVSSDIMQLGEGRQLYDPLIFRLHILDWQMDSGDGNFEQNLTVYDLKQKLYAVVQKFQPGLSDENCPAGSCIRISETQDYSHAGLYHYVQEYKTTLVDVVMAEPVNGLDYDYENNTEELHTTVVDSVDENEPYINVIPKE